ncbi:MAG: zinc-binding alcohol dehydrogenase [Actinomycetota bacterium]|nr:zinc-binding alcohol dehydrogenase [Actinomycetota bacterium]
MAGALTKGAALQAQAVFFVGPRTVAVRKVALPQVDEGEVLVRTSYSGISAGTELLAYRGEIDPALPLDETIGVLDGSFSYPFRYGYSCVGRVERSRADLPEGTLIFAFHPHQDRFVVPAQDVIALPDVDPRLATLLPLVETALQLSLDAGPVAHESVVVLGLGAVGLLTAALLAKSGAQVLAAEPRAWRREAAAVFSVVAVTPDELPDAVAAATDERGVPLLIEASGNPAALASGLALLAHEGCALVASWFGTKPVPLPLGADFHRRRLSIRSSQVSTIPAAQQAHWSVPRRRSVALALMDELPLTELATHSFPFAAADEAFQATDSGAEGLLHAALRYG